MKKKIYLKLMFAVNSVEIVRFQLKELYIEGPHAEQLDRWLSDLKETSATLEEVLHECIDAVDYPLEFMEKSGEAIDLVLAIEETAANIIAKRYSQTGISATRRLIKALHAADGIYTALFCLQIWVNPYAIWWKHEYE